MNYATKKSQNGLWLLKYEQLSDSEIFVISWEKNTPEAKFLHGTVDQVTFDIYMNYDAYQARFAKPDAFPQDIYKKYSIINKFKPNNF